MSIIVVFILVAVLGVILGTTFALVRTRSRHDATLLEPGPGAAGVPPEVKEDVARHVAELQLEAEEEVTEVDAELAAAVDEAMAPPVEAPERPRFRDRLGKARSTLSGYLTSIGARGKIDAETWDELEEALIRADVGMGATTELLDVLRARVKADALTEPGELLDALKEELKGRLAGFDRSLHLADTAPSVWLFVGVNGVGKTTTIGKLGKRADRRGPHGGHGRR